jgi:hypothetical protein
MTFKQEIDWGECKREDGTIDFVELFSKFRPEILHDAEFKLLIKDIDRVVAREIPGGLRCEGTSIVLCIMAALIHTIILSVRVLPWAVAVEMQNIQDGEVQGETPDDDQKEDPKPH